MGRLPLSPLLDQLLVRYSTVTKLQPSTTTAIGQLPTLELAVEPSQSTVAGPGSLAVEQ